MSKALDWICSHPAQTGIGALVAVSVIANAPSTIQSNQALSRAVEPLRQEQIAQQAADRLLAEQQRIDAAEAERRYEFGCIPLYIRDQAGQFTALAEGMKAFYASTNAAIPDRTPVCDVFGNAGIIAGGQIQDIRFTGNKGLVDAAIARSQAEGETGYFAQDSRPAPTPAPTRTARNLLEL